MKKKTAEQLFEDNQKLAYWVLKYKFDNLVITEDLTQIAFLGLWKACLAYNSDKNFSFATFATTCIMNEINKSLRKDKKSIKADYSLDAIIFDNSDNKTTLLDIIGDEKDIIELTNIKLDLELVKKNFLSTASSIDKQVFIYYFIYNLNQKDIAKLINRSQCNVSKRLKKIRDKIVDCYNSNMLSMKVETEEIKIEKQSNYVEIGIDYLKIDIDKYLKILEYSKFTDRNKNIHKMYYIGYLTQREIADKVNLSIPSISIIISKIDKYIYSIFER